MKNSILQLLLKIKILSNYSKINDKFFVFFEENCLFNYNFLIKEKSFHFTAFFRGKKYKIYFTIILKLEKVFDKYNYNFLQKNQKIN